MAIMTAAHAITNMNDMITMTGAATITTNTAATAERRGASLRRLSILEDAAMRLGIAHAQCRDETDAGQ